jgi:hypothetical protein
MTGMLMFMSGTEGSARTAGVGEKRPLPLKFVGGGGSGAARAAGPGGCKWQAECRK